MPVRGPGACAGFCGPCDFFLPGDGACSFCFGDAPYFSISCCVELYFVASFNLSMVASRSLLSFLRYFSVFEMR
jgi:hypothetical protein